MNGANYACTKAAILSLTKTLALEWAKHNIRVNAIIPGRVVHRPAARKHHAGGIAWSAAAPRFRSAASAIPTTWPGLPPILPSADASYMTGQGVAMNGGRVLIP